MELKLSDDRNINTTHKSNPRLQQIENERNPMLVLSRKEGESVVIDLPNGDQLSVIVSRISGDRIRLAFDAPSYVLIRREELECLTKKSVATSAEHERAAASFPPTLNRETA